MEEKKTVDFESEMKKLESIVNQVSSGELSLEDSLKAYEEGTKIIRELEKALKNAEEKVEKIISPKE